MAVSDIDGRAISVERDQSLNLYSRKNPLRSKNGQIHHESTYWEKAAETEWGAYISDIERRTILRAHELSAQVSVALEIGAEGGRWSKLLANFGWSIVCTDINAETLAICQKRIPAAEC